VVHHALLTSALKTQSASGNDPLATWTGEACDSKTDSGRYNSQWTGVTCLGSRVVGLNLTALGATGRLEILGQLTELTVLKLFGNSFLGEPRVSANQCVLQCLSALFAGPVPAAAWRNLTKLAYLNLNQNKLSGAVTFLISTPEFPLILPRIES